MTLFITILNFDKGSVDVIRTETVASSLREVTPELVEEILDYRGYSAKNIQYMVTEELSINMV